jgi:SAM-dependent methyltransferase
MNSQIQIFDRALVRRHRRRAAPRFAQHRALYDEAGTHLLDRLADVKRDFPAILDLHARDGSLGHQLQRDGRFIVNADMSEAMLRLGQPPHAVIVDEEWLPFAEVSFDLIISNLSLHWVNDLPGVLAQVKRALKPGGLFLAALYGGATLIELRSCLMEAELAITGGVAPRLSPNLDMATASGLLQRAGFQLPVTDSECVTLTYPDLTSLMHDLRGMGETNALIERSRKGARRDLFVLAESLYRERYPLSNNRLPATFEIVFLHGWV